MSLLSTIIDTFKSLDISDTEMTQIENWEENWRFLGIKLINVADFSELAVRFLFNTFVLSVDYKFDYYNQQYKNRHIFSVGYKIKF